MKNKKWKLISGGVGALALVFAVIALVVFLTSQRVKQEYDALLSSQEAGEQENSRLSSENEGLAADNAKVKQENEGLQSKVGGLEKRAEKFSIFNDFMDGKTVMTKAERITLNGKKKILCYGSNYTQNNTEIPTVLLVDEESGKQQSLSVAEKDQYKSCVQDYDGCMFADFNGDGRDDIAIQGNYYTSDTTVSDKPYFTRLLPFLQQEDGSFTFDKTTYDRWVQLGAVSVETYMAAILSR